MNTPDIPEDIRSWLASVPELSKQQLEELRTAAETLDDDPAFRAELIKGRFVNEMIEAMEQSGKTQAEVARDWGKSRQYLNKLLNEDNRVNFTVETLCGLAHQFDLRVELQVLKRNEVAYVMSSLPPRGMGISFDCQQDYLPSPPPIDLTARLAEQVAEEEEAIARRAQETPGCHLTITGSQRQRPILVDFSQFNRSSFEHKSSEDSGSLLIKN